MYKKKELQLSYFSICEGKKLDDKIVTYFALKAGSTVLDKSISERDLATNIKPEMFDR